MLTKKDIVEGPKRSLYRVPVRLAAQLLYAAISAAQRNCAPIEGGSWEASVSPLG